MTKIRDLSKQQKQELMDIVIRIVTAKQDIEYYALKHDIDEFLIKGYVEYIETEIGL